MTEDQYQALCANIRAQHDAEIRRVAALPEGEWKASFPTIGPGFRCPSIAGAPYPLDHRFQLYRRDGMTMVSQCGSNLFYAPVSLHKDVVDAARRLGQCIK